MMNLLLLALEQAPTDMLGCVLTVLCGLLIAAVCWLSNTVVSQGKQIAALDQHRLDSDRRFMDIKEALRLIQEKLDKILANGGNK